MNHTSPTVPPPTWSPLTSALGFIFRHYKILLLSLVLVAVTGLLTWVGYLVTIHLANGLTGHFFQQPPAAAGIKGWFLVKGWWLLKMLFLVISRVIAFYLAFLLAFSLTSPGYVFLSTATEKTYLRDKFTEDAPFSWSGTLTDLVEGIKIAGLGIVVTIAALVVNLIPGLGQILVFLLYTFYSALMFVDYPASRRRWSLGRKIGWLKKNWLPALRLGLLPTLVSLVPLVNIFFMALLFPLFTVYTTLNFIALEDRQPT
ncbi:MAG: EI24 domain-containing protein [Deltaproteobacteria bacterium]|nr:EI24 domain-containing protein [Deltaproteobacteria bacterium]